MLEEILRAMWNGAIASVIMDNPDATVKEWAILALSRVEEDLDSVMLDLHNEWLSEYRHWKR